MSDSTDSTRNLDARSDGRTEAWRLKVREKIYDLAVSGQEFTAYDIANALTIAPENRSAIGSLLRAATIAGLIKKVGKRSSRLKIDPKDWVAGGSALASNLPSYKGVDSIIRRDTAAARAEERSRG